MTVMRIEIGNGGERNGRRAPVEQKQEQHDSDDDQRLDQNLLNVVDRHLDEVGLPEQDGGRHILRRDTLQIGERRLDRRRSA